MDVIVEEEEEEEVVVLEQRRRRPLPRNTAITSSGRYIDCIASEPLNETSTEEEVDKNSSIDLMEESDEEVIEFELERAVEKVHTHIAYCPNCCSRITKVVLRRRKRKDTGAYSSEDNISNEQEVDENDILRIHVCLDNNQVTTLQLSPLDNNLRVEGVHIPGLANAVINYLGNHVNNNDGIISGLKPTLREEENTGVNDNIVRTDHLVEEIAELEFERAVEKVQTHTRYSCPNCRSQITKVILRRRKPRPDKQPLMQSAPSAAVGDNVAQMLADYEDERDRGPDVFRCLSCFSFFIPTGNRSKLFRISGDKSGKENALDEQAPIIAKKQETTVEHDTRMEHTQEGRDEILPWPNKKSSFKSQVYPTGLVSQHIITKTKIEAHSSESLEVDNISPLKDAAVGQGKDTVITIDSLQAVSSATAQGIIRLTETEIVSHELGTQSGVADSERTEARKKSEIEEIKSEVHGGLAESFTRPSVVSSAAGVGAATYGSGEGPTASTKSESEISEDDCPKSVRLPDETTQLVITSGQSKCETREQHNPNFQLLLGKYEGETIGYEYEKKALSSSRNIKKALGIRNKFRPIADSVPLYRLHMSGGGTNDPVTLQFNLNPDVFYQLFQR